VRCLPHFTGRGDLGALQLRDVFALFTPNCPAGRPRAISPLSCSPLLPRTCDSLSGRLARGCSRCRLCLQQELKIPSALNETGSGLGNATF